MPNSLSHPQWFIAASSPIYQTAELGKGEPVDSVEKHPHPVGLCLRDPGPSSPSQWRTGLGWGKLSISTESGGSPNIEYTRLLSAIALTRQIFVALLAARM